MTSLNFKLLGEVCDFYNGKAHEKAITEEGRYKVINSKFISSEGRTFKLTDNLMFPLYKGDLCLVMSDVPNGKTLAKCFLVDADETYSLNQRICAIRTNNFDLKFLFYQLNRHTFLLSFNNGENQTNLRKADILNCPLWAPPIPEQKRIVAILDQAFADIEQARAKTEQNLKNARELFESYLQQVFSQRGEGWVEKKIGDLTALITKGSSPKWQGINYVEEPGVLFVTSENVGVNQMIYKKTKYVEEAFNTKGPKSILSKGDVLTNIVGASIGRTAIFDRDDVANINQAVCLMRCNSEVLYNEYLAYLLNSPYLVKVLHDNEVDNARANLSLGFFRNLEIPLPTVDAQKVLVEQIKAMHLKTDNLEVIYQRKLDSLHELKKSILQKVFSGELTKTLEVDTNKGAVA